MNPVKVYEEHKGIVEDVCWSRHQPTLFASVGDDRKLILADIRQDKVINNIEAHSQEVNSVDFNHFNEFLILTASNDKLIALWDIRNLSVKINTFDHHKNDVVSARWNPNLETIFASSSADRRVNIWDISKLGSQQSIADNEEGAAELLVYINLINII
jgi:histone-binding protein RBBP4